MSNARIATLVLTGVLVATSARATPPAGPGFEELVAAARLAREKGDFDAVLEHLRAASRLKPSPLLDNNIARTLEELGRYREAHSLFNRVANDPKASTELRSLDAARAGALQSRLGSAWVVVHTSAGLLVDGESPGVKSGSEFPAKPGARVFEYRKGAEVILRKHDLPAGRRLVVRDDLTGGVVIALPRSGSTKRLTVDGYRVRGVGRDAATVRFAAGTYRFEALVGEETRFARQRLKAGRYHLSTLLPAPRTKNIKPPPVIQRPPPSSNLAWQITVGGVGVAAAGVATWLVLDATSLRDEVRNAQTGPNGEVIGMTLPEAESRREEADLKSTLGVTLFAVGGAAIVGAVTWLVLDLPPEKAPPVTAWPRRDGIVIGGSF